MSIAVIATKRARGRLYVQIQLGDEARDCRLSAQAQGADERPLPLVQRAGEDEGLWLLMLPSLSATQAVRLAALSDDDTVVEEQTVKFGPLAARISSPMQLMRTRGRSSWEVPTGREALGEWEVWVDRLIATRGGQDICQGHATLRASKDTPLGGALQVRALDAHGHDVAASDWVSLCDEVRPTPNHPKHHERYLEFSVRIPNSTPSLVVWIDPAEGTGLATGFASLTPRVTASLREAWRSLTTPAYEDDAYDAWFAGKHAANAAELTMQREASRLGGPTFSVVCVARAARPEQLRESVDSVLAQTYANLELVLVNAAPSNHQLESAVRGMELADARVRYVPLGADFGDAAATSEGIDAATGQFVCLLNEGDLLAPDALWCVSEAVASTPEADLLYTDEDELVQGHHLHPRFKPDWDPDLLLGYPYLGGLLCVRTSLLSDMETMGTELDGAQAYRVALHASTHARRAVHVARVLYHVRHTGDDKALGAARQGSGLVALRQHLADTNVSPRASMRVPRGFELAYELPEEPPLVSVIVLNRDRVASLDCCLTSLRAHAGYDNYEIVVVENGSTDPETFAYYRAAEEADERLRTIFYQQDAAFDESSLINFGASRAKGELLLIVHNDVELTDDGALARLAALCLRAGTGAASARSIRADGTIECCGMALSATGPHSLERYRLASDEDDPALSLLHATTMVTGTCLMVRKDAFDKVGGMRTECGSRLGVEDLCLRLWGRGYRVVLDPQVTVVHHRPLAADVPPIDEAAQRYQAVGRLWDVWPFSACAADPLLSALADPSGSYRNLPQ